MHEDHVGVHVNGGVDVRKHVGNEQSQCCAFSVQLLPFFCIDEFGIFDGKKSELNLSRFNLWPQFEFLSHPVMQFIFSEDMEVEVLFCCHGDRFEHSESLITPLSTHNQS